MTVKTVLLYNERPVESLSREELIEALYQAVAELENERSFTKATLDILSPKPRERQ